MRRRPPQPWQMRSTAPPRTSTAYCLLPQEQEMPSILWQSLEKSNVDMVEEMTAMMTSQRALQSAAQVLKMYDQVMSKAVTDVGRL